jgi:hypothetical protein
MLHDHTNYIQSELDPEKQEREECVRRPAAKLSLLGQTSAPESVPSLSFLLFKSREAIRRAAEASPDVVTFPMNRAVIELACGDYATAHAIFSDIYKADPKLQLAPVYLRPRALAACRMFEAGQLQSVEGLRELIVAALKEQINPINMTIVNDDFTRVLAKLTPAIADGSRS